MTKPKFFFEPDESSEDSGLTTPEQANTFFDTLREAGIIKENPADDMEVKQVSVTGTRDKLETRVVLVEYGIYNNDYSIHITPTHSVKNLASDSEVRQLLMKVIPVVNEYVPTTLQVDLFLPRTDWKMKVISLVIKGGASAWNLDTDRIAKECAPRILALSDEFIMGKK